MVSFYVLDIFSLCHDIIDKSWLPYQNFNRVQWVHLWMRSVKELLKIWKMYLILMMRKGNYWCCVVVWRIYVTIPDSDTFPVFFPIFEHKINVSDELYDYWILRFIVVFPAKSFYKKIILIWSHKILQMEYFSRDTIYRLFKTKI